MSTLDLRTPWRARRFGAKCARVFSPARKPFVRSAGDCLLSTVFSFRSCLQATLPRGCAKPHAPSLGIAPEALDALLIFGLRWLFVGRTPGHIFFLHRPPFQTPSAGLRIPSVRRPPDASRGLYTFQTILVLNRDLCH